MKKSKYFKIFLVLTLFISFLYSFFVYKKADTQPVSAYINEDQYAVYSGRNVYEYHRSILNEKEKILYDEIKESYLQFKDNVSAHVDTLTKKELSNAFNAVELDHPEIFWIDSYSSVSNMTGNINTHKIIRLGYSLNKEEAIKQKEIIDEKCNEIILEAKKYRDDYDKIKYVHDQLIYIGKYTQYSEDEKYKFQSIISIFDDGRTVCAGYAYGFKFIMDKLGIKSIAIKDVNYEDASKSHIWNMVQLKDIWYYIDITWDDNELNEVSYKFFLNNKEEFFENHNKLENLPD